MVSLVKKGHASVNQSITDEASSNLLERSRKLILRCYNMIASQQELSGVQVAMHIMGWPDHYTSHKFTKICLISVERYLQQTLDEAREREKASRQSSGVLSKNKHFNNNEKNSVVDNSEERFSILPMRSLSMEILVRRCVGRRISKQRKRFWLKNAMNNRFTHW